MSNTYQSFDSRLKNIDRTRTRLVHGYHSKVSKDGLIVFKPKRRKAGFPLRALVFVILGFFIFKGFILAHTGNAIYEQRIAKLQAGTVLEQAGAFVMQADPVTQSIAQKLRPFVL